MKLNELGIPKGRKARKAKRVGRGNASGQGSTAGRGHKGQRARAGGMGKVGFEGGQMPLARRMPKRGFTNIFRREFAVINLDQLVDFPAGTTIDAKFLKEKRLVRKIKSGVKVLGRGEVQGALILRVAAVSATAKKKIEAAGGSVEVISG